MVLCAAAAGAAYFMQNRSFSAAERAGQDEQAVHAPAPTPEQVVIDGKLYPKNASGIYKVNGVTTFVKNDSKIVAAEKAAREAARGPRAGEKIMDPGAMNHLIDGQGAN